MMQQRMWRRHQRHSSIGPSSLRPSAGSRRTATSSVKKRSKIRSASSNSSSQLGMLERLLLQPLRLACPVELLGEDRLVGREQFLERELKVVVVDLLLVADRLCPLLLRGLFRPLPLTRHASPLLPM